MKAVLQRVTEAGVHVYSRVGDLQPVVTRRIGRGFVVLLGVAEGDGQAQADWLHDKMIGLRVFADGAGKMNLDIRAAGGAFLVVSQFTLLADMSRGRRPSFVRAAAPSTAEALYRYLVERLQNAGFQVETGNFGAHMLVEIANDGPVTILLDTEQA